MPRPILAGWQEIAGHPEKLLAVVGGAVVGALLLGLFIQLVSRVLTTRKLPRWALNVVRLLGAVVAGWVVALWMFGGGGWGLGGAGGLGLGDGTGSGTTTKPANGTNPTTRPGPVEGPPAGETVRVEVLGPAALKKGSGVNDPARCYRIDGEAPPRLRSLSEVKVYIRDRQMKEPPLRHVAIVLYKDSPSKPVAFVTDLATWAADLMTTDKEKMKVDFVSPDANAPDR